MSRARAARRGDDQEVGGGGKLARVVEIGVARFRARPPVVIAHAHAEPVRTPACDFKADGAQAQNTQALAGHLRPHEPVPISLADPGIGLGQMAGGAQ
ncbi:hypothetical protein D3C78_1707640 [compost metagenome]